MKYLIFILFFFAFLSCNKQSNIPRNVLPVVPMSAVLWDVMQADELVNRRYPIDTLFKRFDTSVQLYYQVFQIHNITADQFKKSITFYQSRPDLLQIILDSLQSRAARPLPITSTDSTKTP
jgi:hypothetical protein